jgi:hypothetical protein
MYPPVFFTEARHHVHFHIVTRFELSPFSTEPNEDFSIGIDLEQRTPFTRAQCGHKINLVWNSPVTDDRAIRHAKMRERLAELKNEALARLERRGYQVRGKTPAQIRQILKRRPTTSESIASNPFNGLQSRENGQL